MAEKYASQAEFNKQINPYSLTTLGVQAADAATFGHLPKMINWMYPNVPVEAARKMIDASADENPTAAKIGTGLGYGYDATLAAAGTGVVASGLGLGGAAAPSIYATRLGLAAAPEAAAPAVGMVGRTLGMLGPKALAQNAGQIGGAALRAAGSAWKPAATIATMAGLGAGANYLLGADTAEQAGTNEPARPLGPATGNVRTPGTPTQASGEMPALADIMDAYEAVHPGNRGGPMSDDKYASYKRAAQATEPQTVLTKPQAERAAAQAAEQNKQEFWTNMGAQVGMDPKTAIAFGRGGGFTQALMENALTAQQGRVTQRMGFKDLQWAQANQQIDADQARAEANLTGDELVAALTTIDTRRKQLLARSLPVASDIIGAPMDGAQNATGQ